MSLETKPFNFLYFLTHNQGKCFALQLTFTLSLKLTTMKKTKTKTKTKMSLKPIHFELDGPSVAATNDLSTIS